MRFVYVIYLSYPNLLALKSIFYSIDDGTKSDKGENIFLFSTQTTESSKHLF